MLCCFSANKFIVQSGIFFEYVLKYQRPVMCICRGVGKDVSSRFNLFSFNGHSSLFSVIVHFNVLGIDMVKK